MIRLLLFMLLLSSCATLEDVQRSRAEKYYRQHPEELAASCAKNFPSVDSIGNIEWLTLPIAERFKPSASENISYIRILGDTGRNAPRSSEYPPCDTSRAVVGIRTTYRDKPGTLARIQALEFENARLRTKMTEATTAAAQWKAKARKRNTVLISIASVAGLAFVGWLVGKFKTIKISK